MPSRRVTQWCTRLAEQNSCHTVHLFAPLVGLEITSTLLEQGAFTDVMLTQDKPLWFNVNGKHSDSPCRSLCCARQQVHSAGT